MKKRHLAMITFLIGAIAAISLAADSEPQPAQDDAGLRIALSSIPGEQPGVFRLELENVGDKDVMVNLGMMLANGKVMMPDAIYLILVDAKGESRDLFFSDRRYPGVAGRVDDYVVPLRAGSTYSLRLSLNDYWCPETKEYQISLEVGEYRIQAVLDANEAQHINGDTQGMRLMNYWTGTLRSAPIELNVQE